MGVGKSCLLHQFTERKCKFCVVAYVYWYGPMIIKNTCFLWHNTIPLVMMGVYCRWFAGSPIKVFIMCTWLVYGVKLLHTYTCMHTTCVLLEKSMGDNVTHNLYVWLWNVSRVINFVVSVYIAFVLYNGSITSDLADRKVTMLLFNL